MIELDPITVKRIKMLHPTLHDNAMECYVTVLQKHKVRMRITQSLRSWDEQSKLYAQGRTEPGNIVTWSKPGDSYHQYGLALDFCLLRGDGAVSWSLEEDLDSDGISDWMEVVSVFRHNGWEWGGDFKSSKKKDYPHLQKTMGLTIERCKQISCSGTIWNFNIPEKFVSMRPRMVIDVLKTA